jgi:hypothetical protein
MGLFRLRKGWCILLITLGLFTCDWSAHVCQAFELDREIPNWHLFSEISAGNGSWLLWVAGKELSFLSSVETARQDAAADRITPRRRISGVYPHLAALSQSWTECGIGAVVPWAGKLWYVSYVAHIVGEGVGLYEIDGELGIYKRPESVVGTHAGRLIHHESRQLFLGPYVIDENGNVRVLQGLLRERITAFARHLFRPAELIYAQAMEGRLYEVDVRTLEVREVADLRTVLKIEERPHFKGAYTAGGRLVVANNTYDAGDQTRGYGGGRLAEWDGKTWRIIRKTAYCEVTTSAGPWAIPDDPGPLWATGWDRHSLLLSVLDQGKWSHFRLPKASQSHDHAWCTEWPRIQPLSAGFCLMDMHGMFFRLEKDFAPGRAFLEPFSAHLRIVPDFCEWQGGLVLAGNQNSAMLFGDPKQMQPRHRTGGQPQSNLWFGSLEELSQWGEVHGWGSVPLSGSSDAWNDSPPAAAEYVSEPLLVAGYKNRTLYLLWEKTPTFFRCAGQFPVEECPEVLLSLPRVSIPRGDMTRPGRGFQFTVNQPVTIYLAVHERGQPQLPAIWKATSLRLRWRHDQVYSDRVYRADFPAGTIVIPEHNGQNERGHFGVPHLCFIQPKTEAGTLEISGFPADSGVVLEKPSLPLNPGKPVKICLEGDRSGRGEFSPIKELNVTVGQNVFLMLEDHEDFRWVRVRCPEPLPAVLHLCACPRPDMARRQGKRFAGIPLCTEPGPIVAGAALPIADSLWVVAFQENADGRLPLGFFRLDGQLRLQALNVPGASSYSQVSSRGALGWNRQMVGTRLVMGPYVVDERGQWRRIEDLPAELLVATIRHPAGPDRCFLLTEGGSLYEVDLPSARVLSQMDITQYLGLESGQILFRAGHQTGSRLILAGVSRDGQSGLLLEGEGTSWRIVDNRPFVEVCNLGAMSEEVVAIGWDRASALWLVRDLAGRWECLRLPKAQESIEKRFAVYRPRIREVETERVLLDCHGLFYEVSGLPYARSIVPVCAHGRLLTDFASYRGLLVLLGAAADAPATENLLAEGPVRLWLGKTDDLWELPPPQGYGGPWWQKVVRGEETSEPFLIYGFSRKVLRLSHTAKEEVRFQVEVDPTVHRRFWVNVAEVVVPAGQEVTMQLPNGLSAHWLRLRVDRSCTASGQVLLEL